MRQRCNGTGKNMINGMCMIGKSRPTSFVCVNVTALGIQTVRYYVCPKIKEELSGEVHGDSNCLIEKPDKEKCLWDREDPVHASINIHGN